MKEQSLQIPFRARETDVVLEEVHHAQGLDDVIQDDEFRTDAERAADFLATEAAIDQSSEVLEIGAGGESMLVHLAERFGCCGEAVFHSEEYVDFAREILCHRRRRLGIDFRWAPADRLPYPEAGFTHVVGRNAMCGMPDGDRVRAEIYRVLRPWGILACTDFVQSRAEMSPAVRQAVCERLGWPGGPSLPEYRTALERAGFETVLSRDLGDDLVRRFRARAETLRERAERTADPVDRQRILRLASSCALVQAAVEDGEIGWALFIAHKPESGIH
ncbi:methyltransferase domain-containing protein [Marinactinospora thermotolerans]|uniref:Methylase involved in ubiquinone/menaquinone biosynthesis n=1 Tax=Marinactinospora thermotolerans DSM 45154 TaxID=1122192 RepID=A0A1T4SS63_9ACTN|nr:methyltransferase domain-containing protein [Marinactinospora thermotolerans]SKA30721.1 Methylase involved in ubiquinone/menaquinone biosynthesis [Marinactinospora thermotolerans DSM 45154]